MQALITAGQEILAKLGNVKGIISYPTTLNGEPLLIIAARGKSEVELTAGAFAMLQKALEHAGIKTKP